MVFSGTRSIPFGGEFVANEGGQLGSLRDTWEWSGTFWTERQDMGPVERAQHRMVYDSARDRVVLFGGIRIVPGVRSSDLLSDTWELPGSLITITELTFPRPLGSATLATVSLSAPAPIGGITVSLVSSNPELLEVPESVRIGDGKASEQFTVKPGQFDPTTPHFLTVTARLGTSVVSTGVHPGQVL